MLSFKELNLHPKLMQAIEACGFTQPTEIQRAAIPSILDGCDVMASAQTGTGKTAAFVLPALQLLLTPPAVKGHGPRVLVLTPTRELAMQINEDIAKLGRFSRYTNGTVVGGMPYPRQTRMLKQPLDLLVATPGRLMDHMQQGRVDFSRLEILVLDEADRMLDMGFIDAVKTIAAKIPKKRQTLLFSATLEGKVMNIAKQLLRDPVGIQLSTNHDRHASIKQSVHHVDSVDHKHRLLAHYIGSDELSQALIFTATKRGADKLARNLKDKGHSSAALHGDMGQGARKRTVDNMRRGKFRLLVATDVAARGLDIKGISHVINFDMPMVAEDYIHRIGRTGRAGATGNAVSLVGAADWQKLTGIERLTGSKLTRSTVAGLEPVSGEPSRNSGKPASRKKPQHRFHAKGGPDNRGYNEGGRNASRRTRRGAKTQGPGQFQKSRGVHARAA